MSYFTTGAALTAALNALPASLKGTYKAFDAFYYAENYMDAYTGSLTPIEHFVQYGASRGYQPNADFNPAYYQSQYSDLAGFDSAELLYHYVRYGLNEGRPGNAALAANDWDAYLTAYPAVAAYVSDNLASFGGSMTNGAIAHYVKFGQTQGFTLPNVAGQTFMLTAGVDHFEGTVNNDTFNAYPVIAVTGDDADTLRSFDILNGGAGNDTLNIVVIGDGNATQAGSISGIENINIDNREADTAFTQDRSVNAAGFNGAVVINQIGNATHVTNLAATTTAKFTSTGLVDDIDAEPLDVTTAATATSASIAYADVTGDLFEYLGLTGIDTVAARNLHVSGAALKTVNLTGNVVGLTAGDAYNGGTLARDVEGSARLIITAGANETSLTLNSSINAGVALIGGKLNSFDASASTGDIGFDGQGDVAFRTFKTGSGNDLLAFVTDSVKNDPETTATDETVNVAVDSGAGNDTLFLGAGGAGATTINTGEGNDDLTLFVDVNVTETQAIGAVTVTTGAGDDTVTALNNLLQLTTKLNAASAVTTSDVKFDGGDGTDTLVLMGDQVSIENPTIENATYERLAINVTGFEAVSFEGDVGTVKADKLSQFTDINFHETTVVTGVAEAQTITFEMDLTATAKGFIAGVAPILTTYAGTLNLVQDNQHFSDLVNELTANADVVNLTVAAGVQGNGALLVEDLDGEAWASSTTLNDGAFQSLNVTMQSAQGTGASSAGVEAVSVFSLVDIVNVVGDVDVAAIKGVKTIDINGQGDVYINANAVSAATLTTIDLSGMTALVNLDANGNEVTDVDGLISGYLNLSISEVVGNDANAENIILGGAKDTVITGSTGAKMDTITGLQLVAKTAEVANAAKSDEIFVNGAVAVDAPNDFKKLVIDAGNSTLTLALQQAAASADNQVIFTLGSDSYIYVDGGTGGLYDVGTDILIKVVGVTNLDLLTDVVFASPV